MKKLKIGIIGPTNMEKLTRLTKKSERFFLDRTKILGKILAEIGCELWINSDKGMASLVAFSYKQNGGKKLVVLYPKKGHPWPNKHAKPYRKYADKLSEQPNWFWANYMVTAIPDICICVGLSAGVLSELAYIKWNKQFKVGNLKRLLVIKELVRGKKLPPEIDIEIRDMTIYANKTEDTKRILRRYIAS